MILGSLWYVVWICTPIIVLHLVFSSSFISSSPATDLGGMAAGAMKMFTLFLGILPFGTLISLIGVLYLFLKKVSNKKLIVLLFVGLCIQSMSVHFYHLLTNRGSANFIEDVVFFLPAVIIQCIAAAIGIGLSRAR